MNDEATLEVFQEPGHPLWDVPVKPFGESGIHVAFSKEVPRVQIDGELTLDQLEAIVRVMKRRQY
jgi:hypothetical protein